jgi:glycosyltransferase involved in cell wall biosynthesis
VPAPATALRVHVLIDSLTWGGAETLLGDLAAGAPSAGIELSVGYLREIDGSPAALRLREQGIEPQLVPVDRLLDGGALLRVRRHLAHLRPDLLHTHLELADVFGLAAARSLGLPALSSIHLVARRPTVADADGGRRGLAKARFAALVRRHAAGRVVAVSEAARAAYLQTGWDLPGRVVRVHNGIARSPEPGAGERVRSELGLPPEALVASMLTVLRPGKGHDVVFEAVEALLPRFPDLRLVVLGDGPDRQRIGALASRLGGAVVMPGHRQDVMSVLAASDVMVHPTLMDAFPTALLEAASARVPVVATAVGGIPEIVQDGLTGFLIDAPPSAIALAGRLESLLADERARHEVGERAHARFLQSFTAEAWALRLRAAYEEVLEEPGPRPRSV